jgi:Replicase family/Primase C terminal 1 (PriCT-1)/Homeodomain-like domain
MQVLSQMKHRQSTPTAQLNLFDDTRRWPKKPYCSDDLESGVVIRSLSSAIKKQYIQANPPWLRVWSIHDLDYQGAANAWDDAMLPPPTWQTINKENGHAHVVYGLRAPVLVDGLNAREAPMRYLSAIESMMREKLRGDAGFSGLITKNPAHPLWRTLYGGNLYDLSDLAEYLPDIEKHINRKRKPEEVGLGRNVTLFDSLRLWSYKQVLRYKAEGGLHGWNAWMSAVNNKALERNGDFKHPLDGREVWHIAKSVAKWTWRNMSEQGRHEWAVEKGRAGGKASGKTRLAANEDKRASARLMRIQGMSTYAIADELGVSQKTISNWLRE